MVNKQLTNVWCLAAQCNTAVIKYNDIFNSFKYKYRKYRKFQTFSACVHNVTHTVKFSNTNIQYNYNC